MKKGIKALIFCLAFAMAVAIQLSPVMAQLPGSGDIWRLPAFQSQPLHVPTTTLITGDILIDNFEYWDSPYNHGWVQSEPDYPFYGFRIGYATIFNTVLDLQEGSRVLDVYRPQSIFLLGTPYERHGILYNLFTPPSQGSTKVVNHIDLKDYPVLSFKFRAPVGIEPWDIFEFDVMGFTHKGYHMTIRIRPVQPGINVSKDGYYHSYVARLVDSAHDPSITVQVDIGRNFLNGSWHVVWINLHEAVKTAVDNDNDIGSQDKKDWYMSKADKILLSGRMFRLDDIVFRAKDYSNKYKVDIFEIGPRYAQLFEPYRYLFMADYSTVGPISNVADLLLDPNNFITDPNQIRDLWIRDLLLLDPNYHQIDSKSIDYDPDYTHRWLPGDPNYGKPDPVAALYLRDGFFIDGALPIFAHPNFRIGGDMAAKLRTHGTLGWNLTGNGYGQNAIQAFLIQPLPINPYDGMPTYIMNRFSPFAAIRIYGKAHYGPAQCFILESALWNSGVSDWPHIAYIDYIPQYFEDLIMTLEVTDGVISDVHAFPLSVVNYPVENYPPVLQPKVCPRVFYVGEYNECIILFLDSDCFIFSLAQSLGKAPSTSHLPMLPGNQIRTDQDRLSYRADLRGYPSYQYGPWMYDIIDPHNGLCRFTPRFEGTFLNTVICTDDRGAWASGSRNIFCVNQHISWLNHRPVLVNTPSRPQVYKAGEEINITYIKAVDPDGDEVYASCNIGSIGLTAKGDYIWTFQSNFPGVYNVEITFYDIRGGFAVMRITLVLKPWWSY